MEHMNGVNLPLVARVAVNVRLYFDVSVATGDEEAIKRAALAELECVEDEERIRITRLRHANVYPTDDWPALSAKDIAVCDVSPAREVTPDTRFPL
jgi:hypothetical protein